MVRLITHNLLACHAKGCAGSASFPLALQDAQVVLREAEFNEEFLRGFLPRVEWGALVGAARQVGDTSLPDMQPEPDAVDEDFLKKVHHVLLEIHIEEGAMICPKCAHSYPISNGIPNMVRPTLFFSSHVCVFIHRFHLRPESALQKRGNLPFSSHDLALRRAVPPVHSSCSFVRASTHTMNVYPLRNLRLDAFTAMSRCSFGFRNLLGRVLRTLLTVADIAHRRGHCSPSRTLLTVETFLLYRLAQH
ncbi:hypothetical protein PLICRDRAFT_90261, partial [Plicaturopsis crispa FD-325 SS-3]